MAGHVPWSSLLEAGIVLQAAWGGYALDRPQASSFHTLWILLFQAGLIQREAKYPPQPGMPALTCSFPTMGHCFSGPGIFPVLSLI